MALVSSPWPKYSWNLATSSAMNCSFLQRSCGHCGSPHQTTNLTFLAFLYQSSRCCAVCIIQTKYLLDMLLAFPVGSPLAELQVHALCTAGGEQHGAGPRMPAIWWHLNMPPMLRSCQRPSSLGPAHASFAHIQAWPRKD